MEYEPHLKRQRLGGEVESWQQPSQGFLPFNGCAATGGFQFGGPSPQLGDSMINLAHSQLNPHSGDYQWEQAKAELFRLAGEPHMNQQLMIPQPPAVMQTGACVPLELASADAQAFLRGQAFTPHGIQTFLSLAPQQQANVMNRGHLRDARDPTAILMSRITKFKDVPIGEGDWNCPACGDMQFRKNAMCRSCQAPNPYAVAPNPNQFGYKSKMCNFWLQNMCRKGPLCSFAHGNDEVAAARGLMNSSDMPPPDISASPPFIQAFLQGLEHVIRPHAIKQFLDLNVEQQKVVVTQGTLAESRDPTAVLISRLAKARKYPLAMQQPVHPADLAMM